MSPIQTSSLPCSYSKSPWIDACLSYLAGVEMSTMIVWVRKKDCPQKNPCLQPGKAYLSHSTMAAEIAARTVQGRVHEIWCRWHFPHLSSALDSQVWCTHLYCKVLTFHLNIPFFCHSLSSIMLKRFSTEVAASSFLSRVQAPWVPTSKLVWLRWSRTSLEHFLHSTGLLCWLLFLRTPPPECVDLLLTAIPTVVRALPGSKLRPFLKLVTIRALAAGDSSRMVVKVRLLSSYLS